MYNEYICHHGIKGMHWGVRRFQNYDGTRTELGKERRYFNTEKQTVLSKCSNTPKPFVKQPVDISAIKKRGGLDDKEAKQCLQIANDIFKRASRSEPKITDDVISSVRQTKGKMYGLENRLKQVSSLAAKIGSDSRKDDISFETAGKGIKDSVRYTIVSTNDNFVSSYNQFKNTLLTKEYEETKCKNYFEKYRNGEVQHKAVQCTYKSPDGFEFEIQFQTPESQAAKELKIPLYEEARQKDISQSRRIQLENEMHELAENVPYPDGITEIRSHNGKELRHFSLFSHKYF